MITTENILNIDNRTISIEEIESKIDASILRNHGAHSYEVAYITYAIPTTIADVIAKKYINAGWNYVFYRVFSDCTNFILSMNDPVYFFNTPAKFSKYIKLSRKNMEVNRQ